MLKGLKNYIVFFAIIFTIATIISSVFQLINGVTHDTNIHIMDRAALVVIGILSVNLMNSMDISRSQIINFIPAYLISIGLVMAYVWLSSFYGEIHIHGYRDMFINFSVGLVVTRIGMGIINKNK